MTEQQETELQEDLPIVALRCAVLDFCEIKDPTPEQVKEAQKANILLAGFITENFSEF